MQMPKMSIPVPLPDSSVSRWDRRTADLNRWIQTVVKVVSVICNMLIAKMADWLY